ncbi:TolC family outer membrane protein [Janthinobacterium fluminis]|uniref:TolC family outer membrane protein n=1 Tax=Janthinobacterium fluminis TaxID=2987524 RepID=A0ABT5K4B6_9BURK|nr:TolC family outer membrane protein [Janthinobacterium fluminis]MDC8759540.1 TolC family outer membrane protein [Janthinobacterium fluminis]
MRKPLIAVLITGAFFSLSAQAADLVQVYQQALANDAQYASARAALAVGREQVPQGLAGLLPVAAISGSNSRGHDEMLGASRGATVSSHTNTYNLTLSQPLFRWANWQQYQQSKLAEAASQAQFAQAQQDLITRVAQAYFDVLTAQDNLGATQAQKVATTEQLASAKRNFEVGTQTITDTHEAQAAYDLVVAQEFAALNDLDIKRAALQTIIGDAPTALAPMRAGVAISRPEPAAVEPWIASAEQQNYGVVGAQLSLESAKRDISRSRAGHYPTVDLVANAGHTYTTGSGGRNNNAIGVSWNVPLFSGFSVTSKVRESIAQEDKARSDLESARRNASQGARQAYLGVNSGLAQVKALEAAEVSSKSALESNKLGYQVGVRINIDVLNAQKQLFSTQKDLAKARYDTIMNGLRLKSAAGTLKEADLAAVNSLLQR